MRAQPALQEKTVIVVIQVLQGLLVPLERLEQDLQDLLQLSQDPLESQALHLQSQDRQDFQRPGLKDAILPLQVLAGQPEQRRPSQAQQGWQERQDLLVTQLVRQEP